MMLILAPARPAEKSRYFTVPVREFSTDLYAGSGADRNRQPPRHGQGPGRTLDSPGGRADHGRTRPDRTHRGVRRALLVPAGGTHRGDSTVRTGQRCPLMSQRRTQRDDDLRPDPYAQAVRGMLLRRPGHLDPAGRAPCLTRTPRRGGPPTAPAYRSATVTRTGS